MWRTSKGLFQADRMNGRPSDAEEAFERPALKGRGVTANPAGRFEHQHRLPLAPMDGQGLTPGPLTELIVDRSKTIINRIDSPDLGFDRTINPYRGCEHGCAYCYARPSHAYWGLSAGLDFETRIFYKPEAPELLRQELASPRYKPATVVIGGNTDPYQPVERTQMLTRRILEVLAEHRHPFVIITKSALVLRDLDIIAPMAARGLASVAVSLTTLDADLARKLEPRAASPARRLETIGTLAAAGVPVTVLTAPIIPAINDPEIEALLEQAAGAGARSAGYVLLRLPHEVKTLFAGWLDTHYPDRAARVLSLVAQCHGGKLYDSSFGQRRTGQGPYAELIAQRFARATRALGLDGSRMKAGAGSVVAGGAGCR